MRLPNYRRLLSLWSARTPRRVPIDRLFALRQQIEALEDRTAPAIFTVSTTNDSGAGSLRQAILDSNATGGIDTIAFNLTPTPNFIAPLTILPTITDPVVIDGTTQPGYSGSPLIEIDGFFAGSGAAGFQISAGGSTVKGLSFVRWQGDAIVLDTADGNTITGNYFGLRTDGTTTLGNRYGISMYAGSDNNVIGGTTAADRNYFGGNTSGGISISGALGGSTGNVVQGNWIGLDATGAVSANATGVLIANGATNNTIGGTAAGAGNVISGNSGNGVFLSGASTSGNTILGNFIGTDKTGTLDRGNTSSGIAITGSVGTIIGGTATSARNIISGNDVGGITLTGTTTTQVLGNYIGTDVTGALDLGNASGIILNGGNDVIGGLSAGAGNVISP